ncbi:MAG: DUF4956 domain-containing protein [Lachnospiraceae bacterium]|nr:DUF4956 domain-containing protein [Lachnospiraceae bacterium]
MKFNDILKSSFIDNFAVTGVNITDVLLVMLITLIISLYIFFIYRIMTSKNFYNKSFNISLPAVALITAAIIITIQSSVVVSLGMVGALSIVRFRTAIKDPMDLVFMFWAIATGIICGAGLYMVAFIAALTITLVVFLLDQIPMIQIPKILVIQASVKDIEDNIIDSIAQYAKYYKIKSRNISQEGLNMIVEVKAKEESLLLQNISDIENVEYVSLLDYDGEVTSL